MRILIAVLGLMLPLAACQESDPILGSGGWQEGDVPEAVPVTETAEAAPAAPAATPAARARPAPTVTAEPEPTEPPAEAATPGPAPAQPSAPITPPAPTPAPPAAQGTADPHAGHVSPPPTTP